MKVYKYRYGNDHDLDALQNNYIWAATRETLNDPFECTFIKDKPNQLLDVMSSKGNISAGNVKSSLEEMYGFVKSSGIYSLSTTPIERLFWAHYGDSHRGFCIEYDLDVLCQYWGRYHNILNMHYRDVVPEVDMQDLLEDVHESFLRKMFGIKSKCWEYEKEIRITTTKPGRQFYNFRAVTGIYFGYRMPQNKREEVMRILQGRSVKYYEIALKKNEYLLETLNIQDIYADSDSYEEELAPLSDDMYRGFYGEESDENRQLMEKAIKIIQKNPYCECVNGATFSEDQNEKQVFVSMQDTRGGSPNCVFSETDILLGKYPK
ncbi:DUF2971 domain-containing protein [Ignatzschineria sp. LJL83]